MERWRLLKLETQNAFMNMAVDEAILRARIDNIAPNTVRFYRWNPSAVSIGKFQRVEEEVNLENCRQLGVDVVRRVSGGGAVYHDAEGEVTYSVVAEKQQLGAKDITDVYVKVYAGLAAALKSLGLKSDFNEGNVRTCPNLTVNGKKISGSAQCHKAGVVLQHGTLLLDVNLEEMFTFLRVQWAKTRLEVVNIAKDKITSIKAQLGRDISTNELIRALTEGFNRAFNVKLENGELTVYEGVLAEKLYRKKYATAEWNMHGINNIELTEGTRKLELQAECSRSEKSKQNG